MKKTISILLTLLLIVSIAPLAAFAEEPAVVASGACGDNVTYTLTADGTLTISGAGPMGNYYDSSIVPWKNMDVKNVVIEEGVTDIGVNAFYNCASLLGVRIPKSIKVLPLSCFYGCISLENISMEGIETIEANAFGKCKSLKTLEIPATVTSIDVGYMNPLFESCEALEKIVVDENNPVYKSDDAGALFTETSFLQFPANSPVTDYNVPEGITTIEEYAFKGCKNLTVLHLSRSITKIHVEAMYHLDNLMHVYYGGPKHAWDNIVFLMATDDSDGSGKYMKCDWTSSSALKNATLHCTDDGHTEHEWGSGIVTKKATPTADGVKTYTCAVCENTKTETIAKASKVTLSKTKFVYNGKVQKPTLTVKDSAGKTISSKYYTAAWSNASSKGVGKYTVTVTFKGIYSGKKALTYTIVPKAVTGLKKAASTTKSIKLSWAKATGAKYYQVYAYSAGAWRYVKTVSVNSVTVTKINGNALAAGKNYYFRVRALDESKKCVGAFSATLKTGTRTAAPKITALTSPKAKTVKATWGKVTGAKSYVVYKSLDGKKWTKAGTTTGTSFTLTKLTGGKPVYVKLRAVNAYKACSAFSAVKKITVKK